MVLTLLAVLVCFFGNYLPGLLIVQRLRLSDLGQVLPAFMIGAAINTTVLTLWSFLGPITPVYCVGVVLFGLLMVASIPSFRQVIWQELRQLTELPIVLKVLVAAIVVGAVFAANETADGFDEGLYYIQTVRWLQEFGTVPGLGNLHNRFAYNASWHTLASGFTFISDGYYNDLGIALFLSMAIFVIGQLGQVLRQGLDVRLFFLLVWVFLLTNIFSKANSISADFPAFVVGFFVGYMVLLIFSGLLKVSRSALLFFFGLLPWALTIKLSSLPFACITGALLVGYTWRQSYTLWPRLLLLAGVVLLPFVARGWVLSGYLFYPLTFTAVGSPDWQVPVAEVELERLSIQNAAKLVPLDVWVQNRFVPASEWFVQWVEKTNGDILIPVVIALLGAVALWIMRKRISPLLLLYAWVLLALTVQMLYMVPDLRFIYAQPWLVIAIGAGVVGGQLSKKVQTYTFYGLMVVQSVGFILIAVNAAKRFDGCWIVGNPAPTKQVYQWQTQDKQVIHVVSDGDQCWNSTFPCIPNYECGKIETRMGTYASGFRVVK